EAQFDVQMLRRGGDASGFIARRDDDAEQLERRLFGHRIFNRECTHLRRATARQARINTNFLSLLILASISVHSWLVWLRRRCLLCLCVITTEKKDRANADCVGRGWQFHRGSREDHASGASQMRSLFAGYPSPAMEHRTG